MFVYNNLITMCVLAQINLLLLYKRVMLVVERRGYRMEKVACTACGAVISSYEVFPENVCVVCYEKAFDANDFGQMEKDIYGVFKFGGAFK